MLKTLLLAIIILAVGVAGMAVTVIVKKEGRFPDGEISHNKALRSRGIICAKEQEMSIWKKKKGEKPSSCPDRGCEGCSFFAGQKSDTTIHG